MQRKPTYEYIHFQDGGYGSLREVTDKISSYALKGWTLVSIMQCTRRANIVDVVMQRKL